MRLVKHVPSLVLALLACGATAHAADKCLAGASQWIDRAQIDALRAVIESSCPCDTATARDEYRRCSTAAVKNAIDTSALRRECRATVNAIQARATCGLPAAPAKVPCLKKGTGTQPKLRCAIKQESACVDSPSGKVRQIACGGYTHCIDAADANADLLIDAKDELLIDAKDELRCAVRRATTDIPSEAEPPNTPGSPGVTVTNPKLITQFGSSTFDLNNARYTRYAAQRPGAKPDAILILVPGFEGGAGGFQVLAENLVVRMAREQGLMVEVWAFDRRSNQLEDRAGILIGDAANDPQVALDWLFGGEIGLPLSPELAGLGRRAVFYDTQTDVPFLASWTPLVHSRDIDAVVEAAHLAVKNGNVFLGGHSAGTGFAARYAATDFDFTGLGPAEPGYAKLRGLVLLKGGGGSTSGTPPTSDTLDRIEARFDGGLFGAVRDNAPRCADGTTPCTVANEATDCADFTPPVCIPPQTSYSTAGGLLNPRILASSEPSAIQGRTDPDSGQIIIQVDQTGPNTSAVDKVSDLATLAVLPRATVYGGIGSFVDDDGFIAGLATFVATSVGAPGPVVSGLTTWQDVTETIPATALPDNGPAPTAFPPSTRWGNEKEITRFDRLLGTFVAGDTNFSDWYYPSSGLSTTSGLPGLDSTALSVGRGRRDIENLTQAPAIDIPVIGFGGSNGLTPVPASFRGFADSIAPCEATSCDGTQRVVDATNLSAAFPTYGGPEGGYEVYIS
jgi:pimeloyl-ACP methyl ester carboxylesterase